MSSVDITDSFRQQTQVFWSPSIVIKLVDKFCFAVKLKLRGILKASTQVMWRSGYTNDTWWCMLTILLDRHLYMMMHSLWSWIPDNIWWCVPYDELCTLWGTCMNMYAMVYSRWNSDDDYVSTVHSSIFVYWCMSGESISYNSIFVQEVWSWMMLMQILRGWCILPNTTVQTVVWGHILKWNLQWHPWMCNKQQTVTSIFVRCCWLWWCLVYGQTSFWADFEDIDAKMLILHAMMWWYTFDAYSNDDVHLMMNSKMMY